MRIGRTAVSWDLAWKIIVTSVFRFTRYFFDMTDKIVIVSTCSNEEEAEKLARMLVEEGLAACVNVVSRVRSYYRWKGAIEAADECMLLVKSSRGLFPELRTAIEKAHSYEVPEVLALPILDGSPDFLSWLQAGLKPRKGTD
jgi:periplasmic divalent cation tolerance protein